MTSGVDTRDASRQAPPGSRQERFRAADQAKYTHGHEVSSRGGTHRRPAPHRVRRRQSTRLL